VARQYGFTARHWIKLAAAGRIPGARQPFGARGAWVFDALLLAKWWDASTRKVETWPGYTVEAKAKSGGAVPSVKNESTAEASRRRIERLQNVVFGNGLKTSTQLHGATSRGGRSKR
jgi:hypothetical protein